MAESIAGDAFNLVNEIKTNESGNLSIKNGRIYNDDAATYVELGGGTGPSGEAVRDEDDLKFTRAKDYTGTGNLTVSNGNIRVEGYGTITLV